MAISNKQAGALLAIIMLAFSSILFFAFTWLYFRIPEDGLSTTFTNVATIGSVAAGLSLVGFSMIIGNSKAMTKARKSYGRFAGLFFVLAHALVLFASLCIGIASGFDASGFARSLGAAFTAVIIFGFSMVTMFLNTLFGWELANEA